MRALLTFIVFALLCATISARTWGGGTDTKRAGRSKSGAGKGGVMACALNDTEGAVETRRCRGDSECDGTMVMLYEMGSDGAEAVIYTLTFCTGEDEVNVSKIVVSTYLPYNTTEYVRDRPCRHDVIIFKLRNMSCIVCVHHINTFSTAT